MGMFDHFPYTNFHELNLDWILQALKEIEHTMDQFVAINSLKFADPIQWNITKQYEKNTIVIDPLTGTAYISVEPVPSGVALTNTDYWTIVFDLRSFVVRTAKNFTLRWEEATTLTATMPINEGQWLVWNDTLYRALSNIIAGDQYVIGSNIERITVEQIKDEIYQTFNNIIGSLEDLDTTDKSNVVAAINEIVSTIGDRTDLDTTDKSNLVAAINENVNYLKSIAVNVVEEGADNSGNDDCSSLINSLISTYSCLYFPSGTYLLSDSINLNRNGLILFGNNATIKTDGSHDAIVITANDITINSLYFDNDNLSTHNAVTVSAGRNINISRISVNNYAGGVYSITASSLVVSESNFSNCDLAVLFDGHSLYDPSNSHNIVRNCNSNSIITHAAFFIRNGIYNDIDSCTGIDNKKFTAAVSYSQYCNIKYCKSLNSGVEAFNLQDDTYCNIEDNIAVWDSGATGYGKDFGTDFGISVWGTGSDGLINGCRVSRNFVLNSYKAAIAVWEKCSSVTVDNNIIINGSYDAAPDDGAGSAIMVGGTDANYIPYLTTIQNNIVNPYTGRNAIESVTGHSAATRIYNNICDGPIIALSNDDLGGNNKDVLQRQEIINVNGTNGNLFYSKDCNYMNLSGYINITGASGAVDITLQFPVTQYLVGSSLSVNKVGAGDQINCYVDTNNVLHLAGTSSLTPADGDYFVFGRLRYRD